MSSYFFVLPINSLKSKVIIYAIDRKKFGKLN